MRLRSADRLVAAAAAVVAIVLVGFGVQLAINHHRSIVDQQQRLEDRATTVAAVTQALLDTERDRTQAQANAALGGRTVPAGALPRLRARNGWLYAEVLDGAGRLLAATPGAPTSRARARPAYIRAALGGAFAWSDAYGTVSSGEQALEWAVPYSVTRGRRVLVIGRRTGEISDRVTGIMSRFKRLADGRAAIVDARGVVLASPTPGIEPGGPFPDRALLVAAASARQGDYGDGRRFAAAPLGETPWRVLVSERTSLLYADVNGARQTVPWIILFVLAFVAAVGLFLVRRSILAAAEIARREANRRYALEINDNVIQRLAVAKLAMETGHAEVTHETLTETLREAQALVNQLIGEREIASGDLRRRDHATSP